MNAAAFRFVVAMVLVLVIAAPRPLFAIRPALVMFYGGTLPNPIFLLNTMVVHDLQASTTITAGSLEGWPFIKVAMFWGPQWLAYVSGEKPLASLTPAMATQHGRLYPASNDRAAVLLQARPDLEAQPIPTNPDRLSWGGELASRWVDVLVRSGVPARIGTSGRTLDIVRGFRYSAP